MKRRSWIAPLAAGLLVAATGASSATRGITVKGSDTMVIMVQRWAEAYMTRHPGSIVQVTGGGSGTGIAAMLNGTTDICDSSRPMKPQEIADFVKKFKTRPHEYKMCLDGLSVYVNKECPVDKLSFPQLEAIFKNWNIARWLKC